MATTAERDVRNYQVDSATEEQFHNIATFAKNMVLKDSKIYEDAEKLDETGTSKYFGDLFLKYIERSLNINDIQKLITFSNKYNEKVDDILDIGAELIEVPDTLTGPSTLEEILKKKLDSLISRIKAFGMFSGLSYNSNLETFVFQENLSQIYENSLLNMAVNSILTLDINTKNNDDKDLKLSLYKDEFAAFLLSEFFFVPNTLIEKNANGKDIKKYIFSSLYVCSESIKIPDSIKNKYKLEIINGGVYLSRDYLNINENIEKLLPDLSENKGSHIEMFKEVSIGVTLVMNNGGFKNSRQDYMPILKEYSVNDIATNKMVDPRYLLQKIKIKWGQDFLNFYAFVKEDSLYKMTPGKVFSYAGQSYLYNGNSEFFNRNLNVKVENPANTFIPNYKKNNQGDIHFGSLIQIDNQSFRYSGYDNIFYKINNERGWIRRSPMYDFDLKGYFNFISVDFLEKLIEIKENNGIIENNENIEYLNSTFDPTSIWSGSGFQLPIEINNTPYGFTFNILLYNSKKYQVENILKTFKLKKIDENKFHIYYKKDYIKDQEGWIEDDKIGEAEVSYDKDGKIIEFTFTSFTYKDNNFFAVNSIFQEKFTENKIVTENGIDKTVTVFCSSIKTPIKCSVIKKTTSDANFSDYLLFDENNLITSTDDLVLYINSSKDAIRFSNKEIRYKIQNNINPKNFDIDYANHRYTFPSVISYDNYKYLKLNSALQADASSINTSISRIIQPDIESNSIKIFSNGIVTVKNTENIIRNLFYKDGIFDITNLDNLFNSKFFYNLNQSAYSLLSKEKIIVKDISRDVYRKTEKYCASEVEKNMLFKGTLLTFFDLSFKEGDTFKTLLIQYKEFNKAYRKLLDLDLVDILLWDKSNYLYEENKTTYEANVPTTFDNVFRLINKQETASTVLNNSMDYYFRNSKDGPILIRDFNFGNNETLRTSKLFKYSYGNPYIARQACESEVIKYYIGDPYKHNGYGKYKYQKEEILQFLEVYSETREYFYKILLNESFINEFEYSLYEKLFLISWSIERFLTSKIESIKDIDSFSLTDTKNFLSSYGLEDLANIIDVQDFYNSEELSKNLIKKYIDLVQNKGSREVINVLQEAFKIPDGTLKIYKSYLTKYKPPKIADSIVTYNGEQYYWNGLTLCELKTPSSVQTTYTDSKEGKIWYWTGKSWYCSSVGEKNSEDAYFEGENLPKNPSIVTTLIQNNKIFTFGRNLDPNKYIETDIVNEINSNNFFGEDFEDGLHTLKMVSYRRGSLEETTQVIVSQKKIGSRVLTRKDNNTQEEFNLYEYLIYSLEEIINPKKDDKIIHDTIEYIWDGKSSFFESSDELEYVFINSEYNVENVFKELNLNFNTATSLASYIESDKYWNIENTEPSLLNLFNIEIENTKYLIPEYTIEVSDSYYTTRYVISLIDFFVEAMRLNFSPMFNMSFYGSNVITNSESIDIFDYLSILRKATDIYFNREQNVGLNKFTKSNAIFKVKGLCDIEGNYKDYYIVDPNTYSITVNREKIKQEFKTRTADSYNIQVDIIYSVLESLIPLFIFSNSNGITADVDDGFTRGDILLSYLLQFLVGEHGLNSAFDLSQLSLMIYNVMELPRLINNGYTDINQDTGKSINKDLANMPSLDSKSYNFLKTLFDRIFITKIDDNILLNNGSLDIVDDDGNINAFLVDTIVGPITNTYVVDGKEIPVNFFEKYNENFVLELPSLEGDNATNINIPDEYINRYEDLIIDGYKELSEILGQTLKISISESESQLMKFLKAVIEYFISYTSCVYDFKYIKSYNSKNENIAIFDRFECLKETLDIDSFFYDEKLNIKLEEKE